MTWERTWIKEWVIAEGRKGCFTKTRFWLDDEGVQLVVRNGWQEQRIVNFFERYWCGCMWHALENCLYTFTDLRETVPKALNSASTGTIHRYYLRYMRTIEAYAVGVAYGVGEFKERVYKGHRQVVGQSKW